MPFFSRKKPGNAAAAAPPRRGTVAERVAYTSARRDEARGQDEARYRLADGLSPATAIPEDDGFAVVAPGTIGAAAGVVGAANALIDGIGHEALVQGRKKGGFMAQNFLPETAYALDSPYMRFALAEEVVAPVASYLGLVPVLNEIDVWYSVHGPDELKKSQLWHLDYIDTRQVKVWIHCSDVGADSGPLTVLDAATSDRLAGEIGYDFGDGYRVSDEQIDRAAGSAGLTSFEGPAGTLLFVDTSRCFHFGSRVAEGGTPRRIFVAQYLTPYGFKYKAGHREDAPFRHLAGDASSELEALVLGAA